MQRSETHRLYKRASARWQSFPIPVFVLTLIGVSIFLRTPSLMTTDPGRSDIATDPAGGDMEMDGLLNLSIEELIEVPIAAATSQPKQTVDDLLGMSIEELMEVTVTTIPELTGKAIEPVTIVSLLVERDIPVHPSC